VLADVAADPVIIGQPGAGHQHRPEDAEQRADEEIFGKGAFIHVLEPRNRLERDDGGQDFPAMGDDTHRQDQPLQAPDPAPRAMYRRGKMGDRVLQAGQAENAPAEFVAQPDQGDQGYSGVNAYVHHRSAPGSPHRSSSSISAF